MLINRPIFEASDGTGMLLNIVKTIGSPSLEEVTAMNLDSKEVNIASTEGTGVRAKILKHNPTADLGLLELL